MNEKNSFEELFDDHLLLRDISIILFMVLGVAIGPHLALRYFTPVEFPITFIIPLSLSTGILTTFLALRSMEKNGAPILRYFGEDPLEDS